MWSKIARGAFLLMLAAIVVSWAVGVGNTSPAQSQPEPPLERIYS